MRVLVVGAGGREHALCWSLAASPLSTKLWCAPGNPGTAELAENVPIGAGDVAALAAFARENAADLVVPGPEAPLVAGLADALEAAGIRCCGPSAAAARLEGSKSFAKEVADAAGIPTALWERFEDAGAAHDFVRRRGAPVVVKADGLAGGKGVVVAASLPEAEAAITEFMEARRLGEAGEAVVIEECLSGEEFSVFALCDGTDAVLLGVAQDHKRMGEGDTGPNTGGMGACSPPPVLPADLPHAAMEGVIRPALAEMARRGTPFRGVLYAGLMLTADGLKLLEFNVRLGDPEAQALLPRLQSDLLPALLAACDGELSAFDVRWLDRVAVAVVLTARGYPGEPARGGAITGLEAAANMPGVLIFHGATRRLDGEVIADGGRVLTVCGLGDDVGAARRAAYSAIDLIQWRDGFYRRDIGLRGLA